MVVCWWSFSPLSGEQRVSIPCFGREKSVPPLVTEPREKMRSHLREEVAIRIFVLDHDDLDVCAACDQIAVEFLFDVQLFLFVEAGFLYGSFTKGYQR